MRKLIYVPMIHSPHEASLTRQKFGLEFAELPEGARGKPAEFWEVMNEAVRKLDNTQVSRIYFEGFTSGSTTFEGMDEEMRLILEEESQKSPEMRVLKEILKRGGTLERTEDMFLHRSMNSKLDELGQIFGYLEGVLNVAGDDEEPTQEDLEVISRMIEIYPEIDSVSRKRDEFVAGRVSDTLREGETGILFMGAGHDIVSKLPKDIETELLDERLAEIDREVKKEIPSLTEAASMIVEKLESKE